MRAVNVESQTSEALPSRRRRTKRGGRHRGAESFAMPPDAPALVLAVPETISIPGRADSSGVTGPPAGSIDSSEIAIQVANLTQTTQTGQPVLVGHLGAETRSAPPGPPPMIDQAGQFSQQGRSPQFGQGRPDRTVALSSVLAGLRQHHPEEPAAVVVPLTTGPHPAIDPPMRETVAGSPVPALLAQPLGPHPLMAQALHERLAEAGLARADRIRMMTMMSAAGGVIVAVAGDESAIRQAEASCVLLASRLAVPVIPASLDGVPGALNAADAAERLRRSGATHLAVAPYVIGPEFAPDHITALAAEIGVAPSMPIGAHPALAQLVALRYVEALEAALRAG